MKRFLAFLTVLGMFFLCSVGIGASSPASSPAVGEVLYHQDFSVLSDVGKSGIVRGTSSSEKAQFTCIGDALELNTFDNDRAYAILPGAVSADSYTIEFDFAFSEIRSENGYIGFLLTCRGTEPTNVTALVIRAGGTIDDFAEPEEALKKAIAGGEEIHVKIPVDKSVLHKIELTAGDKTYTLERKSVKVLDDGGRGFVVRNASVKVGEIYLVNGIGYTAKSGTYAVSSYAADEPVTQVATMQKPEPAAEPAVTPVPETAPDTGETIVPYAAALAVTAMGLFRWKRLSAK